MTDSTFKQRLLGLQGNLLNFAYQLTTNREAAQDLVQDTTLKVLDNEEKYVDNVNFKGWGIHHHEKYLHQQLSSSGTQRDSR